MAQAKDKNNRGRLSDWGKAAPAVTEENVQRGSMQLLAAGGINLGRLRDDEIQRHFLAVAVDLDGDGVAGSLLGFDGIAQPRSCWKPR